jgi:D-alanyl-D-alanine carboxypeptidase/D-alanyl-D-alanine carboxypeptidase (penicillin-binding protein 5/6)
VTTAVGALSDFDFTVIGQPFLYAPIKSGEEAGKLRISYLGREVETVPLYAAEDIAYKNIKSESSEKGLLARIKETLGRSFSR